MLLHFINSENPVLEVPLLGSQHKGSTDPLTCKASKTNKLLKKKKATIQILSNYPKDMQQIKKSKNPTKTQ